MAITRVFLAGAFVAVALCSTVAAQTSAVPADRSPAADGVRSQEQNRTGPGGIYDKNGFLRENANGSGGAGSGSAGSGNEGRPN